MHCWNVTEDLIWIGGNDRQSPLLKVTTRSPGGCPTTHLLLDEKTVLFDVDRRSSTFFENLEHALRGRRLDYVFVHHMEPDPLPWATCWSATPGLPSSVMGSR